MDAEFRVARLERLADLLEKGIISDSEFADEKRKILSNGVDEETHQHTYGHSPQQDHHGISARPSSNRTSIAPPIIDESTEIPKHGDDSQHMPSRYFGLDESGVTKRLINSSITKTVAIAISVFFLFRSIGLAVLSPFAFAIICFIIYFGQRKRPDLFVRFAAEDRMVFLISGCISSIFGLLLALSMSSGISGWSCDDVENSAVALHKGALLKIINSRETVRTSRELRCVGTGVFSDASNHPVSFRAFVDEDNQIMVEWKNEDYVRAINELEASVEDSKKAVNDAQEAIEDAMREADQGF